MNPKDPEKRMEDVQAHERPGLRISDDTEIRDIEYEGGPDRRQVTEK